MQNVIDIARPATTFTDIVKPYGSYLGRYGFGRFGVARYGGSGMVPIAKPATTYVLLKVLDNLAVPAADVGGADVAILTS